MNYTKTAIVFTLCASALNASTIIGLNNSNNTGTNLVADNTGRAIGVGTGSIAIGYFDSNLANADIARLWSTNDSSLFDSFNQVGSSISFSAVDGFFSGNVTAGLSSDEADFGAVGQSVYIIAGNATGDITASSQILVYEFDASFAGDPTPGPSTAFLNEDRGELVIGGLNNFSFDIGSPDGATAAFNLVAVPEPSSSALLAIAGVGFILRRRR